MKIASWNVNSLRVRLPQVLEWLKVNDIDVLAIQETKVEDSSFPIDDITDAGYYCDFIGQKTYNGVTTISKNPPKESVKLINCLLYTSPSPRDKRQSRMPSSA